MVLNGSAPTTPRGRSYTTDQLDVFNLLVHPVWVFDIDKRRMQWANKAAVTLWNAESLPELQERSFDDMSDATIIRLQEYMTKFQSGQTVIEQWTLYPQGVARTIQATCSGIRFLSESENDDDNNNNGRLCMLTEGIPVETPEEINQESLRGVEIIRHLPIAVCQFDLEGRFMFQNPQAVKVFGSRDCTTTTKTSESDQENSRDENNDSKETMHNKHFFQSLFKDSSVASSLLEMASKGEDSSVEAELMTKDGTRWSAVQMRRLQDPVTTEPIVLFSARDITDVVEAKEYHEANEKRSEFLAIMAHEIRTPLHQVIGYIDLVEGTELNEEQQAFVRQLKLATTHLMTVINDVLDYSKLEAGKMKFETIPYELLDVTKGSLEAIRTTIEEKRLKLDLSWNSEVPFKIMGDPNRLRQILLNLLSNAAKFTREGAIHVSVEPAVLEKNGQNIPSVKFAVSDTGIGLCEEDRRKIFRKYHQANASVARTHGGTGLGLSICQLLVKKMEGIIGVESTLGVGTTFWFIIPYKVPGKTSQQMAHEGDYITPLQAEVRNRSLRVLVAEDNKLNQKLVKHMLTRLGHSVVMVENGKLAVDACLKEEFDVVLMDIQMPVMDGIEATKCLRAQGMTNIPIVGLTASVFRNDFLELGFDSWLPKPTTMKSLKAKLDNIAEEMSRTPVRNISLDHAAGNRSTRARDLSAQRFVQ